MSSTLIVGMEVHVELATRSKMFAPAPSPACGVLDEHAPNSLLDATVLALPGTLPVPNREAVEMAMLVGLALNARIAPVTRWDRKSYFYPDLPKGYQISQNDLPLCEGGYFDLPPPDARGFPSLAAEPVRIRIIRAHLEEDAGKLLHEAPGGGPIDFSIADYNRAGTPLLEIVTAPDLASADQAVLFAKCLRDLCRFLGVTHAVMQRGQMRFEPNINCRLVLDDGRTVLTPIVEVKNLNSFKSLRGAIEHEASEQPRRWLADGRTFGPGTKVTRGWDDHLGVTFVQREKEDAHDYRYFPDPDLPPLVVDEAWTAGIRGRLVELPLARLRRYAGEFGLGVAEAGALAEERATSDYFEDVIRELGAMGVDRPRAGKVSANILLQSGAKRANERGVGLSGLGVAADHVAGIACMREQGRLGNQGVDQLFEAVAGMPHGPGGALRDVEAAAERLGLLTVRDDASLASWVAGALAAQPKAAQDVREGKPAAIGRLVGEVMKQSGGKADARAAREAILKALGSSA